MARTFGRGMNRGGVLISQPLPLFFSFSGAETSQYASKKDDATYGDLAERMARMEAKYNPDLEKEVRSWIESKTGEKLGGEPRSRLGE